MNRDEFLREVWRPYPQAGQGWLDAGDPGVAAPGKRSVGGRLVARAAGGEWVLQSGGGELRFEFAATGVVWLEPQKKPVACAPELFAVGDLVCVEVEGVSREGAGARMIASGALLLAPALDAPRVTPFSVRRSRDWADFLAEIRSFFAQRRFIEASTPTLVPSPGTEPFLDPFVTEWHFGSQRRELFLPTSPEFHLKKMLARGWTRVFELKPCFRNGEIGAHHQPEFLMLEWYRAYGDLDAIADDVGTLIENLARQFRPDVQVPPLRRTTMARLFAEELGEKGVGFELSPTTSREDLESLAARLGISVAASDSWDDLFFRIFLEKIEPRLGLDGPVLVKGYPPTQAALARIGEDGFADRFEVYWRGLELANAFHELNDPHENEARFRDDATKKRALGKRPVPIDEDLLRDLRAGMPPSGGIALGVDRLFMALFEIESIAETRAFPLTL